MIIYKGKNSLISPKNPEILQIKDIRESKFLHLRQVEYVEKNINKKWDIINSHDSVAILIYNVDMRGFIFVRQLRMSVFIKQKTFGYMYELCAGLVDKNLDLENIAKEEIKEECGYDAKNLIRISYFYSPANGARQDIFYAQVSESDKIFEGGGNINEHEDIENIFVPLSLALEFLRDDSVAKNQTIGYAILWYLYEKDRNV